MAKLIQCQGCKASDVTKVAEREYICNFCNSRIILEEPKVDLNKFFKTLNPRKVYSSHQTTYRPDNSVVSDKPTTSRLWGLIVAIIVISGFVAPMIYFLNMPKDVSDNTDRGGWNLSYTANVSYFNGSKGPVIWIFEDENYNWEKNRKRLRIYNPITKKNLVNEIFVNDFKTGDPVPSYWDLYGQYMVQGDTIYFTPKEKLIEVRNMYTGDVLFGADYFSKLLGSEIARCNVYSSSDSKIGLYTANGDNYYYYLQNKNLEKVDFGPNYKRPKKVDKYYFMLSGYGDKKTLLRVKQTMNINDRIGSFSSSTLQQYLKNKRYYKNSYGIQSIDSIPVNQFFYEAKILDWNDSTCILQYQENMLDKSPLLLAKIDVNGKMVWKINTENIKCLQVEKKTSFDKVEIIFQNNYIFACLTRIKKACAGINGYTGKIEWEYSVEK